MTQIAILLAAGRSRRFGSLNKLCATISGIPILTRSATNLAGSGADACIAVLGDPALRDLVPSEFHIAHSDGLQSDSLRAGLAKARALGASRCLIALADMPFVPPAFLRQVMVSADAQTPSAAEGPSGAMPPACIPRALFAQLDLVRGDRGAGQILKAARNCHLIPPQPDMLRDIDTIEDLRALS